MIFKDVHGFKSSDFGDLRVDEVIAIVCPEHLTLGQDIRVVLGASRESNRVMKVIDSLGSETIVCRVVFVGGRGSSEYGRGEETMKGRFKGIRGI
jgi:hypothetical protein